ncbi:uncharacterized protein K02A2.6-like [Xenia sp. Carnegie-2017]|uniref:uncharacterized protein K02A2.6-like n=1 Tax=Xenia sp. Carnegie-2017 TaxID=2897299 RepID=UPI001F0365C4|nr:uncharacterized protein K02A2.6-like [Xenia sp. Carnegie-2017]
MHLVDALSRASLNSKPEIDPKEMAHHVHSAINAISIRESRLSQLQCKARIDPDLQILKQYTINGWPSKDEINNTVNSFYNQRHEIVYNNDLLLKGQHIIIPTSMRREMREIIHQGHQGIEKCKNRARHAVYWPGMNLELAVLVSQCATCINHRNRHQRETFISHQIPDQTRVKFGTDLFTLYNRDYVIVTDRHSKFIEVALIPRPVDSPSVVRAIKKIFSRHEIPQIVVCDNVPQYSASSL